ncbi:MAG: type III-A CRISPR-associated RAMP protein Csm5, partial [Selenomonadaceae bacterium]|nr:type III-A CRISPR-associated RAMP protein Csm5 [Selenomonadaceae bacterium]
MNLKTYEITLTAKAPVFVGNGKSYTKKESVIANDKVYIINMNKLYAFFSQKKIAPSFEQFMLSNEKDLRRWLKEKNLFNDALKCADYSLNLDTRDLKGLEIKSAIKDAYGNPYIPGSSLKGPLRTILAAYRIGENGSLKSNIRRELENELPSKQSRKRYLSSVVKNAEEKIFRTLNLSDTKKGDAVNDVLKGFIVGDSEPLSVKD